MEFEFWNLKLKILEFEILNFEFWNLNLNFWIFEFWIFEILKFEFLNFEFWISNLKSGRSMGKYKVRYADLYNDLIKSDKCLRKNYGTYLWRSIVSL